MNKPIFFPKGISPLNLAALMGNMKIARLLMTSYRIDGDGGPRSLSNERDGEGWTPLQMAVTKGNTRMAKYFLGQGADPHVRATAVRI